MSSRKGNRHQRKLHKRQQSEPPKSPPPLASDENQQKGNGSSANAQTEQKRNKKSVNYVAAAHKGKTRMDIAQQALLTIGVCLGVLATLFGILGFAGHRLWALWATAFAIFAFGLNFTCSIHKWLVSLDSPQTVPATQPNITEHKPSPPQSAQPADVPDAISDNQHDTKHAEPAPDARPPYENPTPEYIAKKILETPYENRGSVIKRFIGKTVSWDGRFSSIGSSGDSEWVYVWSGLDDKAIDPPLFILPVDRPENEFLLLLTAGSPIHVDGVIGSFSVGMPELKDITATPLPASP